MPTSAIRKAITRLIGNDVLATSDPETNLWLVVSIEALDRRSLSSSSLKKEYKIKVYIYS